MATTTPELIRTHMITLVRALVPRVQSGLRFVAYNNEGAGDFVQWAQDNPAACTRMFQIRDTGQRRTPTVSNVDVADTVVTFEAIFAYEQTSRAGGDAALDRDDLASADELLLDGAIGLHGYANFTGANPHASWLEGSVDRVAGDGVDFVLMRATYRFYRAR